MIDDPTRPDTADAANGYRPQPTPMRGPRLPGRTEKWVSLPDPYGEFRVKIWVNYPRKLIPDLTGDDPDRQVAAMGRIVLEHNGWCSEEGEPLPLLDGTEEAFARFWDEVPQEVAMAVGALVSTELGKLSASVTNRRGRRS